jgi:hypothetical protein
MSALLDCNLLTDRVFVHSFDHSLTFSYPFNPFTNLLIDTNKHSVTDPYIAIRSVSTARYQMSPQGCHQIFWSPREIWKRSETVGNCVHKWNSAKRTYFFVVNYRTQLGRDFQLSIFSYETKHTYRPSPWMWAFHSSRSDFNTDSLAWIMCV